ncbi:MAG: MMPL family transporter [Nitrospirales bacterium]|nr:MMPL family transporter [Nitrospirales bacterium]
MTVQALKGTPLGTKIDSLLYPSHEQWVGVVMLQGVQNRHMLASSLEDISSGNVYYLDLKDETNRMVTQYRTEILKYLGLGMIGLLTLLGLNLRSFSSVMRTILPVVGALVLVLATLHLFNEALSLFHIASLLLVAGIGIDYALFLSRHGNTPQEHETTISSVWVCSLTTILVFGVMAFSQTPVLHSIGLTTGLGALFCLMMSLVYSRQSIPPVSSQP